MLNFFRSPSVLTHFLAYAGLAIRHSDDVVMCALYAVLAATTWLHWREKRE